jgi:hypothetical protein
MGSKEGRPLRKSELARQIILRGTQHRPQGYCMGGGEVEPSSPVSAGLKAPIEVGS